MKIKAEVLSVRTTGDELVIRAQGSEVAAADWRPMIPMEFKLADTPRTRKAIHVGRHLEIDIRPV